MPQAFDEDSIARLRLMRTAKIGPVTYAQLLARFGTPAAALAAVPDLARRGGGSPPAIATRASVEAELRRVDQLGARHVFLGRQDYPVLLAETGAAPPAIIVRGRIELLALPAVAMVGARNASAAACRLARQLAGELSARGVAVVSGLARGIDTAAHQGALGHDVIGATIGVVAGGIDIAYPPENEALQREMGERGLVVAEQPPGTEPRARHFPYRNRIIAGLAQITVVVEAAPKSGSLITARYAADYGREVAAAPGSPLDPRAQGCNLLIRDGATLVQSADDVMELMRPLGPRPLADPPRGYAAPPHADIAERDRRAIVALLGPVPVPVDELVRQAGLAPATVQIALLELELAGRLERHAGGRVSLA